jgi:hypothetical protein
MKILCRSSVFVQSIGFVQFPPLDTRAPPVSGIFFCTVLRVLYRKREKGVYRGEKSRIHGKSSKELSCLIALVYALFC